MILVGELLGTQGQIGGVVGRPQARLLDEPRAGSVGNA